jgi:hypothetical protein
MSATSTRPLVLELSVCRWPPSTLPTRHGVKLQMYTIALLSAQRTARAATDIARRSTFDGWGRVGHPGCTAKLGLNAQSSRASRTTKPASFPHPTQAARVRAFRLAWTEAAMLSEPRGMDESRPPERQSGAAPARTGVASSETH